MKPAIIFLASYAPSLINFRLKLMQAFQAVGYNVIAIAPEDKIVAEQLNALKIQFISINMARNGLNPFADLALLKQLIKIFRQHKPDAIFSYTIKPVIYGSIAAKLAGVPHIYSLITGTGYVFIEVDMKSKLVGKIAQLLFKIALWANRLVLFQNPDNLAFFRNKKIIASDKSATVVNGSGIDCEQYQPIALPNTLSFLMIARFVIDKGIREFIAAARIIRRQYPEVRFKLVGWVDTNPNSITQEELEGWIKEGLIEYLGKLNDVREAIASASVYVLPSYHEGTPRTVLEAMAMGRPIITTLAAGCKETVIPGENGLLVPIKNVEALAEAMTFFITHPEKIPMMGEKSRELALSKYEVTKVNQSILTAMGIS